MIDFKFDKVIYRRFRNFVSPFYIRELIGFDSEAFTTGEPFMFCDSNGKVYDRKRLYVDLFRLEAKRIDFGVWNLKYDSGAILYSLPYRNKRALYEDQECVYKGIRFEYIPHKLLRISRGKTVRNFWDIMPFYHSSLESASTTYLGKHKQDIETKKFTPNYVRKNRRKVAEYCIVDAKRTSELGNLMLKTLLKFDLKPRTLYSAASISFQHFINTCPFQNVWRFWKTQRDLLRFASEAYFGGKFEVTARGRFTGTEYDISSAYGYEIANLLDLRYAEAHHSKRYEPKADYSFLRVVINNKDGLPIPCTYKKMNLNMYPAGVFKTTITKAEYEFLIRHKIPVDVLEGWHLTHEIKRRPYYDEINRLYKIKEDYRKINPMFSKLAKDIVNSFYGKFVQVIEDKDGSLVAGMGWNPIYGAIITANVRIRLSELQIKFGRRCLGVHTDSILLMGKEPRGFTGEGIGDWTRKESGDGVVVACGIFQIGEKNANRGFYLDKGHSWIKLLSGMGKTSTLDMEELRVLSWTGQVSNKTDEDINLFTKVAKRFDLNCELKRVWSGKTNAAKLLSGLDYSAPPVVMDQVRRVPK